MFRRRRLIGAARRRECCGATRRRDSGARRRERRRIAAVAIVLGAVGALATRAALEILVEIERRLVRLVVDEHLDAGAGGARNGEALGELGVAARNELGIATRTIPQFERTLLWPNRQNQTALCELDHRHTGSGTRANGAGGNYNVVHERKIFAHQGQDEFVPHVEHDVL